MIDLGPRPSLSRGASDVTATSATSGSSVGSSSVDQQPSRSLLFGEIPVSPTGQASFSNSSVCNLVSSTNSAFLRFWLAEDCRNALLHEIQRDALPAMRLVCHNFAAAAAPLLFRDLTITFKANTFKPSRFMTLRKVGKHVKNLTFNVPHSADSFLPPLLDPFTGEQLTFNYIPQVESAKSKEPKYGTWDMTDLLIRQYPPVFHAATNIPNFIRAFTAMPNITHMAIFSPDQNMSPKYRRSTADYTLVSLRIAMERAPLAELSSLSLRAMHPTALLHLQPVLSYGSTPNSCRRWTQITNLSIEIDSTPFGYPNSDDHVRVIQAYLRSFSTSLTSLSLRYTGRAKGPSPLSPSSSSDPAAWETSITPPPTPPEDSHVHPSARPRPASPKPLRFFRLQYLTLDHATMDSRDVASFITLHRTCLVEFGFEDVSLRNGDWASTLDPLRRLKRRRSPSRGPCPLPPVNTAFQPRGFDNDDDVMDVPCKLSPLDLPGAEPLIMDTLEPQYSAAWLGGGRRARGVRRWLDMGREKMHLGGQERKVGGQLRRVFGAGAWSWR